MKTKVSGWTNAVRRVTRRRKVVMIREPGKTPAFLRLLPGGADDPGMVSHADPFAGTWRHSHRLNTNRTRPMGGFGSSPGVRLLD